LQRKNGGVDGAMQRISTPYGASIKIGPYVFFGVLAVVFVLLVKSGAYELSPSLLVAFGVMGVIGVVMSLSRGDCVDEVFDCGDHLLVKRGGEEERVPLWNIINVNFAKNPQNISAAITLRLATPGKFGSEITFRPPPRIYFGFPPRSEIAEDLVVRADQARRGARS